MLSQPLIAYRVPPKDATCATERSLGVLKVERVERPKETFLDVVVVNPQKINIMSRWLTPISFPLRPLSSTWSRGNSADVSSVANL
jgi:hypothetical protein